MRLKRRSLVDSEAALGIVALCETGKVELVSSGTFVSVKNWPLAEVTHHRAIEILCRELGATDTMRFITQFTNGHSDYMAEQHALFAGETPDQIIADIKQAKPRPRAPTGGIEGNPQE
jgi:hypothetical protein